MSLEEAIFRMIQFATIDWVAVIAAAIAAFAAGMVWYSPAMFGKKWMKMNGVTEKEAAKYKEKNKDQMMGMMITTVVVSAITAFVLANLLVLLNITTLFSAVQLAFWLWIGFQATSAYLLVLYEKKSMDWWIISAGYNLVGLLVSAIVLMLM